MPVNSDVSVLVDDVREALACVEQMSLKIVRLLTDEPWCVTWFFYRASDGGVINVGMHTVVW